MEEENFSWWKGMNNFQLVGGPTTILSAGKTLHAAIKFYSGECQSSKPIICRKRKLSKACADDRILVIFAIKASKCSKLLEVYFHSWQPNWQICESDFYGLWRQVETCNGLVVKVTDSKSRGPRFETDQWSTRNSWKPRNWMVKSKLSPRRGSVALRHLNPIHEKGLES